MKWFTLLSSIAIAGCGGSATGGGGIGSGIAIVASDYKSTVLSLASPDKDGLAKDDCLDSGSVTATLSMALSGDVMTASSRQPGGQLVLIDRTNSVLDYITPTSCSVTKQISVATGFYANPHDVVASSMTKAYVTRFETNATPGMAANDKGDDVLIVNPSTGAIGGRIDLTPYDGSVGGATVQARPDRALLANGSLFVVLGETSGDFKTVGGGKVAVIDPTSDKVTGVIDLGSIKGCSGLDYDDSTKTLLVGCGGDYNDITNQTAQSALVLIDVSGTPAIKKTIGGSVTGNRPVSANAFAFVGGGTALAATYGDGAQVHDALWAIALDSGTATRVFTADDSFTLGAVVWSAARQQAFVSDSSMTKPVVHVLDVSRPGAVKETGSFVPNPKSGLPPRQIAWY